MNETPLQPWIITDDKGVVQCAHCNCMAGLGESCTHVGALLFYIDAAVRIKNSKTVTQEPAYWLLPTGIQKVGYDTIQDTNFQSSKVMKRKLDQEIASSSRLQTTISSQPTVGSDIPTPTVNEMSTFLNTLNTARKKAAILTVKRDYAKAYVPKCLSDSFPQVLSELREDSCTEMPLDELQEHCKAVFDGIKVTKEQAQNVEIKTREQANCKEWFRFRSGRVTASKIKNVCSTKIDKPAQSVIKDICYPQTRNFSSKYTKWGCDHESTAYNKYIDNMILHSDFECRKSGLVINPVYPFIGATPDGIVSCKCCGNGTIEIKCPFCLKDCMLSEKADKSCLETTNGNLHLKRTHPYYYQVQTQIFVCETDFCDFVVWSKQDLHIERIEPDVEFWNEISGKALSFFKDVILCELVGKYYSRPKPAMKPLVPIDNSDTDKPEAVNLNSDGGLICLCQKPDGATKDRVVGCDNENCTKKLFHFKCVNIKRAPRGKWYCSECKKKPESKATKKLSKKDVKT